jgi:hypothetical protein
MSTFGKSMADKRPCVFCGKPIGVQVAQCPFCREAIPQVQLSQRKGPDGRYQMRRGMLYMLLAGVIHYFAAGYGKPIEIPLPAPMLPLVTQYLTPLLFLGGLGMCVYGLFLKMKS